MLTEIRELENTINAITRQTEHTDLKINELINKIDQKFLSISIEGVLLSLPNKAIGSKTYAQKLNSQCGIYEDVQFNKIIRFLSLLEEIELDYNNLYFRLGTTYLTKPNKKDAEILASKYTLLCNEYKLMRVLLDAVKLDKVQFHKTYNLLEDRGVFTTEYDRTNYYNLSTIASNIVILVEQNSQINENLSNINHELWEANSKFDNINETLINIESGVNTGNLLSAVQTYQLYKISKKSKRFNR